MSDAIRNQRDGMSIRILNVFKAWGPMTAKDCADHIGKPVPHVAPRVVELVEVGALVPDLEAGMRRAPSGRGRPAMTYRAATT